MQTVQMREPVGIAAAHIMAKHFDHLDGILSALMIYIANHISEIDLVPEVADRLVSRDFPRADKATREAVLNVHNEAAASAYAMAEDVQNYMRGAFREFQATVSDLLETSADIVVSAHQKGQTRR